MTSRRDFFNSFKKPLENKENSSLVVRPPYALDESIFQNECIACEDKACVASCDEKILWIQEDGTPRLDFTHSGCTFCEECATVCEPNVLKIENTTTVLNAIFRISLDACVAHHGVICFSCKEPCIDDAILFNGLFNPVIDQDKCTSCGFCLARCPTQAIDYTPIPLKKENP